MLFTLIGCTIWGLGCRVMIQDMGMRLAAAVGGAIAIYLINNALGTV